MTRITRHGAVVTAWLAVGALVLSACSETGGGGDDTGGGINVGQVGAYTGQVPALAGQGYGLEAWVKHTNEQGGIEGNKINLYTGDSKGDPTTEVSQITQIHSAHDVVAFAGMGTYNLSAAASFFESNQVPVIGGNTSDPVFEEKPYFYAPATSFLATTAFGQGALPAGKTEFGLVYCKESPGCAYVHDVLVSEGIVEAQGGEVVYTSEASLSAPSFTAQCLAAKNAGVQVLSVAFDPTNMQRLASDCDKQDYRPTYVMGAALASDEVAKPEHMDGAVAAIGTAPWFLDSESVATMREAMAKYHSDKTIDAQVVSGWVAGVVLGQAIENALTENGGEQITSADVLTGLGMIKDETFDGLTPPITFTSSGLQEPNYCYFGMTVADGKWTAENGGEPICPTGSALKAIEKVSS